MKTKNSFLFRPPTLVWGPRQFLWIFCVYLLVGSLIFLVACQSQPEVKTSHEAWPLVLAFHNDEAPQQLAVTPGAADLAIEQADGVWIEIAQARDAGLEYMPKGLWKQDALEVLDRSDDWADSPKNEYSPVYLDVLELRIDLLRMQLDP